jgi:hypothetical protein
MTVQEEHHKAKENRETTNDPFSPELKAGKPSVDPTPLCYDPGPCPDTILQALSDYLLLRTNDKGALVLAAQGRAASLNAKYRSYTYVTDNDRTPYEREMIAALAKDIEEHVLDDGWKVFSNEDRFWWLTTSLDNVRIVEK